MDRYTEAMALIRLENSSWTFDTARPLGKPGGFGAVFAGSGENETEVAVKRLHLSTAAAGHREMQMAADLFRRDLRHVLPFLDWGVDLDTGGYYVVMPLAGRSLQDAVNAGSMPEAEALGILTQIAKGLAELPDIVHRDLKPDNVLWHEERWKLADFGIARFVEESTSVHTLKDCLSAFYAAPEQWNFQRASAATDVYALGCIAYALLTGSPPFDGRTRDELRAKHVNDPPPALPSASPRLRTLVAGCLKKSPGVRPGVSRVIEELGQIARSDGHRGSPIANAAAAVADREARSDAALQVERTRVGERRALATEATQLLQEAVGRLLDEITDESPLVRRRGSWGALLGQGELSVAVKFPFIDQLKFEHSGWNIVAGALIRVSQQSGRYTERSANLWFADRSGSGEFRWYEVGLWSWAVQSTRQEPYGISDDSGFRDVDFALSNITHSISATPRPVRAVDGPDEQWFFQRWKGWFASAATGSLTRPGGMPETYK